MGDNPKKQEPLKQPIPGYEILERLGSGGMGTVFKARQISMDRILALKILKKSEHKDPLPLDRLRREALIIARMDHPNIVKGIDMGETERYYYFAMEFVEGRSLQSQLDLYGPMDELKSARIIRQVVMALRYAHEQKLTHRDIKPSNIILGPKELAKLTDMGLAKGERDLTITREGTTIGTPQYISPEQARSPKAADIRSDIYSLGATYYHTVTGKLPYEGKTMAEVLTKVLFDAPALPEAVRPGLSQATSKVISRMMAKDPRRRYQIPEEVMADLELLIGNLKEGSSEFPASLGMNWKESQRGQFLRKKPVLWGAAALITIFIAGAMFLGGEDDNTDGPPLSTGLDGLRSRYEAGELTPYQALEEIEGMVHQVDGVQAREMKGRIRDECRVILDDLLRPSSPRYSRALAEGGLEKGPVLFSRICSDDAQAKLGAPPSRFSPEIQSFWQERLSEARARLLKRIQEERQNLLTEAERNLDARLVPIEAQVKAGSYEQAWFALQALRDQGNEIIRESARKLGETWAVEEVKADRFLDSRTLTPFQPRMNRKIDVIEKMLKDEAAAARTQYLNRVKAKARALVDGADLVQLQAGLEALMDQAAMKVGAMPSALPMDAGLLLPDLDSLHALLEEPFEARKAALKVERQILFRTRIFQDLDAFLRQHDYPGALGLLETADPPDGEDQAYLDGWKLSVEKQRDLENHALKALDGAQGLTVSLKTVRGIHYEGEIQSVDRSQGSISLLLSSGQTFALDFIDLRVEEVLAWCEKVRILKPWDQGLYAYYRDALPVAAAHFRQATATGDTAQYLEMITARLDEQARERLDATQGLTYLLDQVEMALAQDQLEEASRLLEEARKAYRSTPGWSEMRRRREQLRQDLEKKAEAKEEEDRIRKLFSVPVEMIEGEGIRAAYGFDAPSELQDFMDHGRNWKVLDGKLRCGTQEEEGERDYYHNLTGIRFGAPFDPGEAMTLSFTYRPPVWDTGPRFMGISFFGGCLAIRSFPEDGPPGQVNSWTGDLDDYSDSFYLPQFGETRARKGKTHSFCFLRGERYRISLTWMPGRDLILRVDGQDIYRAKAHKPGAEGIEIRVLRPAILDDLILEGRLKDD